MWQLASCIPLAGLWKWVIYVIVSKLYTVGELCGRGQAMWPWVSCVAVGKLYTAGELYAAGELYVAGELLCR